MPTRPRRPCPAPGCAALTDGGRCAAHRRAYEAGRGTAAARGYSGAWIRCRTAVLARDPWCCECKKAPSTDADHYPKSRRELVALGLDPNDPMFCRGVCHACHSRSTATRSGGFGHARRAGA